MQIFKGNKAIIHNIEIAKSMGSRMKGLLGRREISGDYAIVIPDCSSIHTFFMKFAIDVVMIDKNGKAVCVKEHVRPFRMLACPGAKDTIELKAGGVSALEIKKGDIISIL